MAANAAPAGGANKYTYDVLMGSQSGPLTKASTPMAGFRAQPETPPIATAAPVYNSPTAAPLYETSFDMTAQCTHTNANAKNISAANADATGMSRPGDGYALLAKLKQPAASNAAQKAPSNCEQT